MYYRATRLSGFIAVILVCVSSVIIVAKAQEHLAIYVILYMALATFWTVLRFLTMLRIQEGLSELLAREEVAKDTKSQLGLGTALGGAMKFTDAAVILGFLSISALLRAIC